MIPLFSKQDTSILTRRNNGVNSVREENYILYGSAIID